MDHWAHELLASSNQYPVSVKDAYRRLQTYKRPKSNFNRPKDKLPGTVGLSFVQVVKGTDGKRTPRDRMLEMQQVRTLR